MSLSLPVIVLDIEGTVCPISFVHDVLFPYALKRARAEIPKLKFPLEENRGSDISDCLLEFPSQYTTDAKTLVSHIQDLMDRDVKIGYLKTLQGYLWKSGYESREITAPLFEEVSTTLKEWAKLTKIYIYSSGSVPAQKLLFKHTDSGDLTSLLSGYYDTKNAGSKVEASSYENISRDIGVSPTEILFFSDNPREIDASHAAGCKTTFIVRPGNPEYIGYKPPCRRSTWLELA